MTVELVTKGKVSAKCQLLNEEEIADAVNTKLTAEHGDGSWITATGFSVPGEYDVVIAALQADLDNPAQYKATGFSTHSPADILENITKKVPANLDEVPTDSELDVKHGSGNWIGLNESEVRNAILSDSIKFKGAEIALLRKFQSNRLELEEGFSNNWILYDDDDITPLLTFSVKDKDNNAITISTGAPAKREKGT